MYQTEEKVPSNNLVNSPSVLNIQNLITTIPDQSSVYRGPILAPKEEERLSQFKEPRHTLNSIIQTKPVVQLKQQVPALTQLDESKI